MPHISLIIQVQLERQGYLAKKLKLMGELNHGLDLAAL